MKNRKVLIVVNVQYDFIPVSEEDYKNNLGGALAVKDGDQIIPVINDLLPKFDLIIFTKDWHPKDMETFASMHKGKKPFNKYTFKSGVDTLWPDHCIQNTRGADLHDDIDFSLIKGDFYIFKKGMEKEEHPYSAFGAEGLEPFLNERGVDTIYICGLAGDFCCLDTAIDSSFKGFKTYFILDAIKFIVDDSSNTIKKLIESNVNITESWHLKLSDLTQ